MYAEVCVQMRRKVPKCVQTHTDEYGHISLHIFSHVCIYFSKMCVIKCVCVLLDVTTFQALGADNEKLRGPPQKQKDATARTTAQTTCRDENWNSNRNLANKTSKM